MEISKKKIAKTILLPGLLPRIKELFGARFNYFAILVAQVYRMVRILPATHPYLNYSDTKKFTTRDVIREAANNIKFTKNNIDQILIFFIIIAAIFIFLAQFVLFLFAFFISTANAQTIPTTIEGFFKTNNPSEDLAFRMLDMVFGHPDFFGSKDAENATAIHTALQGLLEFYSFGMIIVGAIIIIYFIFVIVNETAQTGIPFGKRFTHAWVPIRLVVFFGLLIPISNGFNGGQYIALNATKLGSGLATTGWTLVIDTIGKNQTLSGEQQEHNVATPRAPIHRLMDFNEFMEYVYACKIAYKEHYNAEDMPKSWADGIQAWTIFRNREKGSLATATAEKIDKLSFQDISDRNNGNDVHIIFGIKDDQLYKNRDANVENVCGSMVIEVSDISQPGSAVIQNGYLQLAKDLFNGANGVAAKAESFVKRNSTVDPDPSAPLPTPESKTEQQKGLTAIVEGTDNNSLIEAAVKAQRTEGNWQLSSEIKDYGWTGASIWYNKIAEQNGALVTAIHNNPKPLLLPRVMEIVKSDRLREDVFPDKKTIYSLSASKDSSRIKFHHTFEREIAMTLGQMYEHTNKDKDDRIGITGNVFIDTINRVLGTEGLFEICQNTNIHPLAQLSMVGKSLVEGSIRSFGGAALVSIFGTFTVAANSFASFFASIAGVGLLVGFMLFYIVPFFPFMYFFFAVGSWVKTIFEAMIAMPLWALAHLRIDGDGLPGEAAMGGYMLLFEIFIRPILIIFGLLAAITIFAAMVKVLNDVFYLAVSSVSGSDPQSATLCKTVTTNAEKPELNDAYRGTIDQFFFTVMYTIFVYLIAMSAFKLIDSIPKQILRWIGDTTGSFLDNSGDATEGLLKYAALGGGQFGSSIGKGLGDLGKGAQQTIQDSMKAINNN